VILMDTNTWMTAQDLTVAQIERGWPPESNDPVSAVRAAANRLVASKPDLFVRDHGRYRYQGQLDRQSSVNGNGPNSVQAKASAPSVDRLPLVTDGQAGDDWRTLPRTEAVARMLAEFGEPLSPSDLSRMLEAVGRDDPPLAVGKALNHLYQKQRAKTVGRAKWVLTDPHDPWVVAPTTDVAQEQEEVNDDQEMSRAVLTFTGDSRQSDKSADLY
jgi:hypothetical protein